MLATDLSQLVQVLLFLLFADLTALVAAVIGPTYDNLLVPELSPSALYPSLTGAGSGNFLAPAAHFSEFLIGSVVDPSLALVALGVAFLYLARSVARRWADQFDALLPRLIVAALGANFAVPIAGAIVGLAGSVYPIVAGWDGGAWQHWQNLAGYGEFSLSWDNGALAFVLALVEFAAVFGLVLAVGVRDALLAVLLVLLPLFTLVWPFRPLSGLARRGWLLFAELAFVPSVLVVPLELAVRSPGPVLLVGYLGAALASPFLLSVAGTNVYHLGFPSAVATTGPAAQRAIAVAPSAPARLASPAFPTASGPGSPTGAASRAAGSAVRAAGTAAAPMAGPMAFSELLGHGAAHLVRHVRPGAHGPPARGAPLRPGGPG